MYIYVPEIPVLGSVSIPFSFTTFRTGFAYPICSHVQRQNQNETRNYLLKEKISV